jgi:hypothetical protein
VWHIVAGGLIVVVMRALDRTLAKA